MKQETNNIKFPFWQYLNQPLFTSKKLYLHPRRFAYFYRIEHLKRCWEKQSDAKGSSQS
ncbi:MAG: hypothetical protein VKL59_07935 [Nostocaceae cyanobacterium]|nr:hypothetical protein [Nostocaceae cyanobacterium]